MRLYSGMSRNFIEDTVRNQIAGKLENAFFRHLRYKPSQATWVGGAEREVLHPSAQVGQYQPSVSPSASISTSPTPSPPRWS
jgi:hypothetical protein